MSSVSNNDLVIRLNEDGRVLQMLIPKINGVNEGLQVLHEIFEDKITCEESIEIQIGKAVLAFLSSNYTSDSFGLGAYRNAGRDFAEALEDEAEMLLKSGDADKEFEGMLLRLQRFNETWTLDDVDAITAFIEGVSHRGSRRAKLFLNEEWPMRADMLKRRISRTQRNS